MDSDGVIELYKPIFSVKWVFIPKSLEFVGEKLIY